MTSLVFTGHAKVQVFSLSHFGLVQTRLTIKHRYSILTTPEKLV